MAQREKEETEVQLTETLALCANNCGFQRSPATGNLCQSCFQSQIRNPPPSGSGSRARSDPTSATERKASAEERAAGGSAAEAAAALPAARPTGANRCSGCGKRVGLTGFRCRCGELFCGTHRYSDRHVCGYDYKRAGREEIRRDNPVVRAAKIVRI